MTTETKHEELRELHEAATPGPWYTLDPPWLESGETSILAESPDPHVARFICDFDMWQFDPDNEADKISENPDEDARLIVHLRNNVEHYIAQDARIAELEAALKNVLKCFSAEGYHLAPVQGGNDNQFQDVKSARAALGERHD